MTTDDRSPHRVRGEESGVLVDLELSRAPHQLFYDHRGTDAIRAHRDEVIRRLLADGLSCDTLLTLLPDWSERIREFADGGTATG